MCATGGLRRAAVCSAGAMHCDDLVAGGIAQIGKIDLARGAFAPAGRVFDALAAVGDAGVVESLGLLGAGAGEADGAAVGVRCRLAVDRLGDAERAGLRAIPNAALGIGLARRVADGAQHGVIELLGRVDVVGADHYVREHALLSFQRPIRGFAWTSALLANYVLCHTMPERASRGASRHRTA